MEVVDFYHLADRMHRMWTLFYKLEAMDLDRVHSIFVCQIIDHGSYDHLLFQLLGIDGPVKEIMFFFLV